MSSNLADRAHPRLFTLLVVGGLGIALGVLLVAAGGPTLHAWAFRIGFLGFLLLVFGLAGYLAIGVFERRPEP